MTALPRSAFSAGVLRDLVSVAALAGPAKPEHRCTGLPASPAVGLRVVHGHYQVWAGNGGTLVIANRRAAQDASPVLYLDGADLRALEVPGVLRGFQAGVVGNRVELLAQGWRGSVRIRRRGPQDPAGAILGALICEQRACRPPPQRAVRSFAGAATWFVPVFAPGDRSSRRVAMSTRRICVTSSATRKA